MLCDYCKYLETKMTYEDFGSGYIMIHCKKRPCEITASFDPRFNCNIFKPLCKKKALIKKAVLELVKKERNNE